MFFLVSSRLVKQPYSDTSPKRLKILTSGFLFPSTEVMNVLGLGHPLKNT